ncbi:LysR family transcriptional regulator [Acetobacter orientalis]|uniref:LysR family transcriptional regulator n=1 Tax=Acetobacter orientalis TaxID=146474 RepID=A0A2Z5ZEY3_9PROT|nr:LysR family transcriptional regulator [Acetobacter orientalis]
MPLCAKAQFPVPVYKVRHTPLAYRHLQDAVWLGQTNAASGHWAITFFGN